MSRTVSAASALSAALGLAMGLQLMPASAQMMGGGMMDMSKMPPVVQQNMMRAKKEHLQKCYGINAVGRNDCAEGAHSCAGQATIPRDPASFVLLPGGDCDKIAGGKLHAS
ncbi:uncharacterized protein E1O_18750 [Burkholderiales bacterium GJ-E10]|nr:uncharacterized protein E1O_18750 [Burkholderiales bacterium GJ-E10]